MYRRLRWWTLLLCLLPLLGCGDRTTAPTQPTVTGTWTGSDEGVTVTLMLVEQPGGNVTGSGTVTIPGLGTVPFQAQGRHEHPAVTLDIIVPGVDDATFSGTMTDDTTIAGTLAAAPIGSVAVVLQRAP